MGLKKVRTSVWLVTLAVFCIAGTARADAVYVNGSYPFSNGVYGNPPYGGTLNGQSAEFYCVDFKE